MVYIGMGYAMGLLVGFAEIELSYRASGVRLRLRRKAMCAQRRCWIT